MEVIILDDKEPAKKKLKQTRLPFQLISPKIKLCDVSKKRKLSDTSLNDEEKIVKQVRCDSKENDSESINIIDLSEDESRPVNQPDIATFFTIQSKIAKPNASEVSQALSPSENELKSQLESKKVNNLEEVDEEKGEIEVQKIGTSSPIEQNVKSCFVDLSDSKINESEFKSSVGDSDDVMVVEVASDDEESVEEDQSQTSFSGDFHTPSKKDGLLSSDESTPKNTNLNSPMRKLTPKQLQRKLESQKRQEEKERLKLEKLKKLQEEKEERLKKIQAEKEEKQRQKQEREEQKKKEREEKEEAKKKEREEKEEAKKKEREEKERKRLAEVEQKNEEKKLKEEERKKREEEKDAERRKREQDIIEKEMKKKKEAEAFTKFFVLKSKTDTKKSNENINDTSDINFMPFAVKSDMRMAPKCRIQFTEQNKIDLETKLNSNVDQNELYLSELKNGKIVGKSSRTFEVISNEVDEDVVAVDDLLDADCIVETAPRPQKMKVKLLQFQENRRPPYWGTWRKKSRVITARKPLGTDEEIFDYQVDSDDEWEEEEPGELLCDSDDEKDSDCDEKDEYDIDNEFMVPHGYLSDEEVFGEDDDIQTPDSPNAHEVKLKALELEFQAERNEKPERLKPRIFGCLWADKDNNYSKQIPEPIQRFFRLRRILYNNPVILLSEDSEAFVTEKSNNIKRRKKIPEKYFPDLIRLLHGNTNNKVFLYKEFKTFINSIEEDLEISRKSFDLKLKEIAEYKACPDEGPMLNKQCWYVNKEFRDKYSKDITLPNYWKYFLTPKRQSIAANGCDTSIIETQQQNESKKVTASVDITKYIKPLSEENRQKQLKETVEAVN